MQHCEPLAWYGLVVLIGAAALIVVPFLRGRKNLISAWNFLLVGIGIFIGVGCIEAAASPMRFPGLEWFEPSAGQVYWYMAATTIFLVTLLAAYYYDPFSKSLAAHSFNKWPPINDRVIIFVMALCIPLAFATQVPFLLQIVFVGNVFLQISHKCIVFACLFSFLLWYRNRGNLLYLGTFIVLFLAMCFLSIIVAGGRRMILSVLLGPVLLFYFYTARHWRPTRAFVVLTVGMAAIFVISLMYSTIRHFDRKGGRKERTASSALEAVKRIDATEWYDKFAGDVLRNLSQHVVHYALLVDEFVDSGRMEARPLNTFHFIAVYPIPRRIYPGKPRSLGHNITFGALGKTTTWGTGIAGHARYEGGLIVAAMFGYFAAFGVRFFDDPLNRYPTNPFLIAMLATAGMHIIAWPRGDLAVMTFEVGECLFFTWGLALLCRFLFGTDRASQQNHRMAPGYPYAFQPSPR